MIFYLAGGVLVLVLLLAAGRAAAEAEPATVRQVGVGLGALAAVGLAWALLETGQVIALLLLLALTGVLAWRFQDSLRSWMQGNRRAPRRSSTLKTNYLRLSLDHETGTVTGSVRKGAYQGQRVEDLDSADLLALRREVTEKDPPSIMLVETYLDSFMPEWRKSESHHGNAGDVAVKMSRAEALAVLGLREGAGNADILAAHVRLLMKLHPEQGGSDRLVEQVNRAKEVLLGG
jgi:hypothetical protein